MLKDESRKCFKGPTGESRGEALSHQGWGRINNLKLGQQHRPGPRRSGLCVWFLQPYFTSKVAQRF